MLLALGPTYHSCICRRPHLTQLAMEVAVGSCYNYPAAVADLAGRVARRWSGRCAKILFVTRDMPKAINCVNQYNGGLTGVYELRAHMHAANSD